MIKYVAYPGVPPIASTDTHTGYSNREGYFRVNGCVWREKFESHAQESQEVRSLYVLYVCTRELLSMNCNFNFSLFLLVQSNIENKTDRAVDHQAISIQFANVA